MKRSKLPLNPRRGVAAQTPVLQPRGAPLQLPHCRLELDLGPGRDLQDGDGVDLVADQARMGFVPRRFN